MSHTDPALPSDEQIEKIAAALFVYDNPRCTLDEERRIAEAMGLKQWPTFTIVPYYERAKIVAALASPKHEGLTEEAWAKILAGADHETKFATMPEDGDSLLIEWTERRWQEYLPAAKRLMRHIDRLTSAKTETRRVRVWDEERGASFLQDEKA